MDEYEEMTDDEGLIFFAANSMSEPLHEVRPGVCYIKTEAAEMILRRARELSGSDELGN